MKDVSRNPERPSPDDIIDHMAIVDVRYRGIDGEEHDGFIEIHEDLADDISAFFAAALESGFPIERVVRSSDPEFGWDDDKLMAANTTSGFNYRLIKGTDRPSLHGLGRAFDVNTRINPYVRYVDGEAVTDPEGAVYDPSVPGTLTADHPLVRLMRERGWTWGGDWTRENHGVTDYQHFEKRG